MEEGELLFLISFLSSPFSYNVVLRITHFKTYIYLTEFVSFVFVFYSLFLCLFVIYSISLLRKLIHNDCTMYSAIFCYHIPSIL
jgi:hypothetical protein